MAGIISPAKTEWTVSIISTPSLPVCKIKKINVQLWDFPGCPVAKTLHSQCRDPGFDLWSGNWIPHVATKSSHADKDPAHATKIPRATTETRHSQINK